MNDTSRTRIIVPVVCLALIVLLAVVGSVASLGQQLFSVHWALGALYCVVIAFCLIAGVAYPVVCTLRRPVFGLYRLREGGERARRRCAGQLEEAMGRADVAPEERAELARRDGWTTDELVTCFKQLAVPVIDRDIKQAAKTSFVTTAVSQAPAYDMVSTMAVNVRLIRDIVRDCGFRPSTLELAGLYARVMKATLIAGGLEELDMEEVVALIGGNAALSASSVVLASAAQGTANAFLTVRVGVIAKAMLLAEDGPADLRELRRASYGQALEFLKTCGLLEDVKDVVAKQAAVVRDGAADKVREVGDDVAQWVRGVPGDVAERVRDLPSDVADAVRDLPDAAAKAVREARAAASEERDLSVAMCTPDKRAVASDEGDSSRSVAGATGDASEATVKPTRGVRFGTRRRGRQSGVKPKRDEIRVPLRDAGKADADDGATSV